MTSADPIIIIGKLQMMAEELDALSRKLADVERKLEPAEDAYEKFMDSYSEGLWIKHVRDGEKFPGEDMRLRLGRRSMPVEVLGAYAGLVASRKRLQSRIASLKASVSAQQSILSALRTEMEVSRG